MHGPVGPSKGREDSTGGRRPPHIRAEMSAIQTGRVAAWPRTSPERPLGHNTACAVPGHFWCCFSFQSCRAFCRRKHWYCGWMPAPPPRNRTGCRGKRRIRPFRRQQTLPGPMGRFGWRRASTPPSREMPWLLFPRPSACTAALGAQRTHAKNATGRTTPPPLTART